MILLARRGVLGCALCLLAAPAARALEWTGPIAQGGFVSGRAVPGTRISLDGTAVRVGRGGEFAFGFGRDARPESALVVTPPRGKAETRKLSVAKRAWLEQPISGLPQGMVTPPPETLERIGQERERVRAARRHDTDEPLFAKGFIWPATGRISGVYGSRRILNGQPRAPHLGVDVARPTGTPVLAAAPGIVRLAEPDLYFQGGTVILDHGHGVSSSYLHLSRIDVALGQRVDQSQPIAAIGATGRVTGPHLHFEIGWLGIPVDPQTALPPMPES
ncbi:M23 family metallopeptidase [Elioraea rosea]|uniref:M23 family metallopeptidase n=1 Tax=Elioraea rosea TaxID=2492390 RepID=UPI0011830EEA|nr:M23 family metallopeptidase [Elioraea rosea]